MGKPNTAENEVLIICFMRMKMGGTTMHFVPGGRSAFYKIFGGLYYGRKIASNKTRNA